MSDKYKYGDNVGEKGSGRGQGTEDPTRTDQVERMKLQVGEAEVRNFGQVTPGIIRCPDLIKELMLSVSLLTKSEVDVVMRVASELKNDNKWLATTQEAQKGRLIEHRLAGPQSEFGARRSAKHPIEEAAELLNSDGIRHLIETSRELLKKRVC